MNITGSFEAVASGFQGAFSMTTIVAKNQGSSYSNVTNWGVITFNAANGWSGSLATESAHTHTVTASGSIENTGNNES